MEKCPIFVQKIIKIMSYMFQQIAPNYSQSLAQLTQDLLKRVFSHHQHDIDKVMAQCLLTGNSPADLIGKMTRELDPLKLKWTP